MEDYAPRQAAICRNEEMEMHKEWPRTKRNGNGPRISRGKGRNGRRSSTTVDIAIAPMADCPEGSRPFRWVRGRLTSIPTLTDPYRPVDCGKAQGQRRLR